METMETRNGQSYTGRAGPVCRAPHDVETFPSPSKIPDGNPEASENASTDLKVNCARYKVCMGLSIPRLADSPR